MEYRAGMFSYALAFLLGVVFVQQLSRLPELSSLGIMLLAALFPIAILWLVMHRIYPPYKIYSTLTITHILLIYIAIIYVTNVACLQLSHRLDERYIGKNIVVNGYVADIPISNDKGQRFEFIVEHFRIVDQQNKQEALKPPQSMPGKIRLSWYYGSKVYAAEKWQLEVRLKPPHGFINPGGFDYEAWLFQNGIDASGYVRKSALNRRLSDEDDARINAIDHVRQKLAVQLDDLAIAGTAYRETIALIKALAIGDKSSISSSQWRVLAATGTSHLMAISGLHIGLAALFAYFVTRHLLPAFLLKRIPAQHLSLMAGLLMALSYALLAGFSVPTQRAFVMLFIVSLMLLTKRNHRPVDTLGFALLLVLVFDPLAVLSAGFWFSFSAVAVIYISLIGSTDKTTGETGKAGTMLSKVSATTRKWVRLQLLISLFLLPLSLYMFQQVSLVSPLANLLLIPYVSFLVVPVVLLAVIFSFIALPIANYLFGFAAYLLDLVWPVLSFWSTLPGAVWIQGGVDIDAVLITTGAIGLLFFSRPLSVFLTTNMLNKRHYRKLRTALVLIAVCIFTPLFRDNGIQLETGEYKVTILDVGQGSSAVVSTKNHILVFDAGAKFSDKFDTGSSVVVPYLRSQGVRELDSLIISHGDNDHIGGAQSILDAYAGAAVIGQDVDSLDVLNTQDCYAGMSWAWDGVLFDFLSPDSENKKTGIKLKSNNMSCVLQVSSGAGTVLFTGDIEKDIEFVLLQKYDQKLRSDVLIAPHHGSKTSSTQAFIDTVNPKISIFSVGYKNRYKFPDKTVIARNISSGSRILRTDRSGAISVKFSRDGKLSVERYREIARRYWHHEIK